MSCCLVTPCSSIWPRATTAHLICSSGPILRRDLELNDHGEHQIQSHGGASTLPGGLGAAEVSLVGMLALVVGLPREVAATASLLIRFCALWFGMTLGFVVLAFYQRRLFAHRVGG